MPCHLIRNNPSKNQPLFLPSQQDAKAYSQMRALWTFGNMTSKCFLRFLAKSHHQILTLILVLMATHSHNFFHQLLKSLTGSYGENKARFRKNRKNSLLQPLPKSPDRSKSHTRHQYIQCGTIFLKLGTVGSFCHWNVYLCPSKRLSPSALGRATDTSTWMLQEHLRRRFQAPEVLPEHMGKNAASNPLFKRTQPKVSGDLCFTHSWQNSQRAKLYKHIYLWGINCITDRKIQLWATALQIIIFHIM